MYYLAINKLRNLDLNSENLSQQFDQLKKDFPIICSLDHKLNEVAVRQTSHYFKLGHKKNQQEINQDIRNIVDYVNYRVKSEHGIGESLADLPSLIDEYRKIAAESDTDNDLLSNALSQLSLLLKDCNHEMLRPLCETINNQLLVYYQKSFAINQQANHWEQQLCSKLSNFRAELGATFLLDYKNIFDESIDGTNTHIWTEYVKHNPKFAGLSIDNQLKSDLLSIEGTSFRDLKQIACNDLGLNVEDNIFEEYNKIVPVENNKTVTITVTDITNKVCLAIKEKLLPEIVNARFNSAYELLLRGSYNKDQRKISLARSRLNSTIENILRKNSIKYHQSKECFDLLINMVDKLRQLTGSPMIDQSIKTEYIDTVINTIHRHIIKYMPSFLSNNDIKRFNSNNAIDYWLAKADYSKVYDLCIQAKQYKLAYLLVIANNNSTQEEIDSLYSKIDQSAKNPDGTIKFDKNELPTAELIFKVTGREDLFKAFNQALGRDGE